MPIRPENATRYPADWKLRSHFVRFVRARGRCEWCGAAHGQANPKTGATVILTTAHVFDDAPENASLLNLAALCQACHLKLDMPKHVARRRLNRHAGQLTLTLEES